MEKTLATWQWKNGDVPVSNGDMLVTVVFVGSEGEFVQEIAVPSGAYLSRVEVIRREDEPVTEGE